jgi:very-short-patch-repair endonuclease
LPGTEATIEIDGDVHAYNSRIVYDKQRQKEIRKEGMNRKYQNQLFDPPV